MNHSAYYHTKQDEKDEWRVINNYNSFSISYNRNRGADRPQIESRIVFRAETADVDAEALPAGYVTVTFHDHHVNSIVTLTMRQEDADVMTRLLQNACEQAKYMQVRTDHYDGDERAKETALY